MITSSEVLIDRRPITLAVRLTTGWIYLSGFESDESDPVTVHFAHIAALDPGISILRLREGRYALRLEKGSPWHVFGPMSDDEIDRRMTSGILDEERRNIASE